jgi:hypothetical protein
MSQLDWTQLLSLMPDRNKQKERKILLRRKKYPFLDYLCLLRFS